MLTATKTFLNSVTFQLIITSCSALFAQELPSNCLCLVFFLIYTLLKRKFSKSGVVKHIGSGISASY